MKRNSLSNEYPKVETKATRHALRDHCIITIRLSHDSKDDRILCACK